MQKLNNKPIFAIRFTYMPIFRRHKINYRSTNFYLMDIVAEIKERRTQLWRQELRKEKKNKERMGLGCTSMPVRESNLDIASLYIEDKLGFSDDDALREAQRCLDCPSPGCVMSCPANIQIPSFIKNIERGNLSEAWQTLRQSSTLSAICSRVCAQYKQCEGGCTYKLNLKQLPVSIGALERYVANYEAQHRLEIKSLAEPLPYNGNNVAIIGSGPAGLAAAHDLSLFGYKVDVFESKNFLGGVMRTGIPRFRLPAEVIDDEVSRLKHYGVNFILNTMVGRDISIEELRAKHDYKAIFIATGAGISRKMGIEGEDLEGVMLAGDYLYQTNLANPNLAPNLLNRLKAKRVAVIGGGNTAMDVVRTAIRLGAEDAMLIYRRTREDMPANPKEILEAFEEGANFLTLQNPTRYNANKEGKLISVDVEEMELGEADDSGRKKLIATGRIKTIPIDLAVVCVGVAPHPLLIEQLPELTTGWGGTIAVDDDQATSIPMFFSGGDVARGGATVVHAMRDGRRAAHSIHSRLSKDVCSTLS